MGWLGRAAGIEPPKVPAGGRAFACQEDDTGSAWTIRVAMPDEDPTVSRPRLKGSPTFHRQVVAYAYVDWANGDAPSFSYPEGEA